MAGIRVRVTTICRKTTEIKLFFEKLGVPVRYVNAVQKRNPFLVPRHAEGLLHERGPLRLQRSPEQRHAGLLRGSTAFAAIAVVTRTDDIFPNGSPALRPGNHMIEVKLVPRKAVAAVLASALISGIYIVPAEPHVPLWYPIISDQQNDSWNANDAVHQSDRFNVGGN
jgi:hypothetical protein